MRRGHPETAERVVREGLDPGGQGLVVGGRGDAAGQRDHGDQGRAAGPDPADDTAGAAAPASTVLRAEGGEHLLLARELVRRPGGAQGPHQGQLGELAALVVVVRHREPPAARVSWVPASFLSARWTATATVPGFLPTMLATSATDSPATTRSITISA
ncbi:hypothetical protein FQZ97_1073970 [compost metagenome]